MRRLLVVMGLLVGLSATAVAQGSISAQVLRLLTRDNTWEGVQTFANTVGLELERGSLAPSVTTDRLFNLGGNLYFNGVLVATSAGAGTVTSVGLAAPAELAVSGSPVVAAGTLTLAWVTETANTVLAGPTTGAAAAPTFRAVVDDDVPDTITIAGTNNVTWASVDTTGSSLADLTTRSASDLSSGTLPDAQFPATLPVASGVNLTALNASNLASGTVPDARFPATLPAASGANLTSLTAANLSGTLPTASVPAFTGGDVTSAGGSLVLTLANTAVTAASYGDASNVATFTVDAKGRLTAAANVAITFPTVDLTSDVGVSILPEANGGWGVDVTAATNGQLPIGDGSGITLATITGTANQVTVTNGAGSITLSLPQSIATASTPQFARLGLGTGAGATAVITTTGQFNVGYFSDGSCGAADTIDWNSGMLHTSTLSAATCTYTFANPIAGTWYTLAVVQDGTGGRLVTWPTITWQGGSAPTLTTTASHIDLCYFLYTGSAYYGYCDLDFS